MKDMLIAQGGQIKALGDGKYGGYLVRYGSPDDTDLTGDFFTPDTDFGIHKSFEVKFDHGFDPQMKLRTLAVGEVKFDEVGAWIEFQLEVRDEYEKFIAERMEQGKMGLSSGAVGHLVEREQITGKAWMIKSWPIGEASVTPTPAEPRNVVTDIKTLYKGIPEADESAGEAETALMKALESGEIEVVGSIHAVKLNTSDLMGKKDEPTDEKEPMEEKEKVEVQETPEAVTRDEIKQMFADLRDELKPKEEVKADYKTVDAPNVNTKFESGDAHTKAFVEYLRSGNTKKLKEIKAALQEGTDSEGGYLVPNDFYGSIVAKRDEVSFARQAGARVIRTQLQTVDIPTEANASSFSFIAEEGAYGQSEPTFGQVQVTAYKAGFLVKVSEELLADQAANLDSFLTQHIGFQLGLHENLYVLTGTGSSQPQGVLVGGTVNNDHFTSSSAITAAQMVSLRHKLTKPYRQGAAWVMDDTTEGSLRALQGNPFSFMVTPQGDSNSAAFSNQMLGHPVYTSASMPDIGSGLNSVVFGNWNYYALVEREGMSIQRNPYLYQANGQVGLFVKVRWGGAVIHGEAFQIGNHVT